MKDFIDTTAAILVIGLIIWGVTKMEASWRGRSHTKSIGKDAEKEKTILFRSFKKIFLVGIVIVISLIVLGIYYDRTQNELACLKRINYRGNTIYRIDNVDSRNFKTQDEAMNYCLK